MPRMTELRSPLQAQIVQWLVAPGDSVQVASGPLQGLEGKYIAHDGETRAFVLIDLLGQPQKLRMAVESLRIA